MRILIDLFVRDCSIDKKNTTTAVILADTDNLVNLFFEQRSDVEELISHLEKIREIL